MIDFSGISRKSLPGKVLRAFLRPIPGNFTVFILQGKLRGRKWIKGSGTNGFWLGTFELPKQKLFGEYVRAGDVVFDIGAHAGFYSLLAAELAGSRGKVFAFEPLPRNFEFLKRHIKMNGFSNIEPINAAVSSTEGHSFFNTGENSFTGCLSKKGGLSVKTVSIDGLAGRKQVPLPDVMKIDVEGAEADVLKGASGILEKARPVIFLALHNKEAYDNCINLLGSLGYRIKYIKEGDESEIIAFHGHAPNNG